MRAGLVGAVLAAVALGLRLWQHSLQGGPWWVFSDLTMGTLETVAVAASGVCLVSAFFPSRVVPSERRTAVLLTGIGLAGVLMAVRWLSYALAPSGAVRLEGPSLLLDFAVTLGGWIAAVLIGLAIASWITHPVVARPPAHSTEKPIDGAKV